MWIPLISVCDNRESTGAGFSFPHIPLQWPKVAKIFNYLEDNNHYFINFQGMEVEVSMHKEKIVAVYKQLSTYTLLHQHWLHTPLYGAGYHLLQHHSYQSVNNIAPCYSWLLTWGELIVGFLTVHLKRISTSRFGDSEYPLASVVSQTCWKFLIWHTRSMPTSIMCMYTLAITLHDYGHGNYGVVIYTGIKAFSQGNKTYKQDSYTPITDLLTFRNILTMPVTMESLENSTLLNTSILS